MAVIVYSSGRSGTNIVLEILRGSKELDATEHTEEKGVFTRNIRMDERYLTKADTHYTPSPESQEKFMESVPHAKIVWVIRDPRDMALSKIRRGTIGGLKADDAHEIGCLKDLRHMHECYVWLNKYYPSRLHVIKMEDVLLDLEPTVSRMCDFLGIKMTPTMLDYIGRFRHKKYKAIYEGKVDKSRIALWTDWEESYSGFFKTEPADMPYIFEQLTPIIKEFGYEQGL
jgi:hypothetical protein